MVLKNLSGAQAVGVALWWYRPSFGYSWEAIVALMNQDGRPAGFYAEDVSRTLGDLKIPYVHIEGPDPLEVFLHLRTGGAAVIHFDWRGSGHYSFESEPSGWLWDALARLNTRVKRHAWLIPPGRVAS